MLCFIDSSVAHVTELQTLICNKMCRLLHRGRCATIFVNCLALSMLVLIASFGLKVMAMGVMQALLHDQGRLAA